MTQTVTQKEYNICKLTWESSYMKLNLTLKQYLCAAVYSVILPICMYIDMQSTVNEYQGFMYINSTYFSILALFISLPFVPIALLGALFVSNQFLGTTDFLYVVQFCFIYVQVLFTLHWFNIKREVYKNYFDVK